MKTGRLEAFSDAVIAIIMTIMVLELKVPHEVTLESLRPLLPVFLSYVLSFVYLGIYWNNHHHLLKATKRVNGAILWANMHLLFWLSLVPFATGWMGENHFAPLPTALYGGVMLCSALAYIILQTIIIRHELDKDHVLADAVSKDVKGKASIAMYVAAIPLAFLSPWVSGALFGAVAIIWLIPDRQLEEKIEED